MTLPCSRGWLLVIGIVLAAVVWLEPIDAAAKAQVESSLKRAVATFAAARAMNSLLSVVQSASISASVGVGGSVHPGAVLEPLDDLVEQFSGLMLMATLSLATQRLLIEVVGTWPVGLLLSGVWLAWIAMRWQGRAAPPWLSRLAIGMLCVRLVVPMVALASEATYRLVLSERYESSQAQIQGTGVQELDRRQSEGLVERFKRWFEKAANVDKQIDALKDMADRWIDHLARLAAIFVVQTVLLPILFVWLMLRLYRVVVAQTAGLVPTARSGAGASNRTQE